MGVVAGKKVVVNVGAGVRVGTGTGVARGNRLAAEQPSINMKNMEIGRINEYLCFIIIYYSLLSIDQHIFSIFV